MGLNARKYVSGFANNKSADQPAHQHSPISTFAIHLLENIISKLATSEISIFLLVSVADQAGLVYCDEAQISNQDFPSDNSFEGLRSIKTCVLDVQ